MSQDKQDRAIQWTEKICYQHSDKNQVLNL
jgi:hypothetical protein